MSHDRIELKDRVYVRDPSSGDWSRLMPNGHLRPVRNATILLLLNHIRYLYGL